MERWPTSNAAATRCYDGGDHSIIVGLVIGGSTGAGHPLLYYRGGYAALG